MAPLLGHIRWDEQRDAHRLPYKLQSDRRDPAGFDLATEQRRARWRPSKTTYSVAPSSGALSPSLSVQPSQIPVYFTGPTTIGGEPLIQVGKHQILVNGTVV